ncbi:MAG: V-type ATPase subunit [Candidatus Methanospirareceae archaeon]
MEALVFVLVAVLVAAILFVPLYFLRITPIVYATAVVKIKEARLMDDKKYEEFASLDLGDFPSFFENTDYGQYLTEPSYENIERGLLLYEKDLDREIFDLIPKNLSEVFDFLIRKWDVANLRRVLGGIHAGIPEEEVREGLIEAGYMYDSIQELAGREMEEVVSALEGTPYDTKEGIEEYRATKNFSFIDLLLKKRMFERVVERVVWSGEKKLKTFNEYLQVLVDSLDLKAMLRGKAGGVGAEEIRRFLVKFEIDREYEESNGMNEFLARLKETRYSYLVEEVGEGLDLMDVERKLEERVLRKGKEISTAETFGLGPVISFLALKEAEIRNIRLIAKLKAEGFSPEKIREFLVFV